MRVHGRRVRAGALALVVSFAAVPARSAEAGPCANEYLWLAPLANCEPLSSRIAPPVGFTRVPVPTGSFAAWLRTLPVAPRGTPVVSHLGDEVLAGDDPRLAAVIAIDIGSKDLQQCADSILRLRGEYLWQAGHARAVSFRFTSGQTFSWRQYARGLRPRPVGARVRFERRARPRSDRRAFRAYLDEVFKWAGTHSLAREGHRVSPGDVRPGDFLTRGGSPGHAVLVLDVARAASGQTVALIGQGFMPAQSFHVLRATSASAWFPVEPKAELRIPFWPTGFPWRALRRF